MKFQASVESPNYPSDEADTDTGYSAPVPDLPGGLAAGSSLEETTDLMREAIRMHLAGIAEYGEVIPEPKTIAE